MTLHLFKSLFISAFNFFSMPSQANFWNEIGVELEPHRKKIPSLQTPGMKLAHLLQLAQTSHHISRIQMVFIITRLGSDLIMQIMKCHVLN